jgi:CheY-like chemotaxis protein
MESINKISVNHLSILIVDDVPAHHEIFEKIGESIQAAVLKANNLRNALKMFLSEKPDLVIINDEVLGAQGKVFANFIATNPTYRAPTMVFTSNYGKEVLNRYIDYGYDDVMRRSDLKNRSNLARRFLSAMKVL